VYITIGDPPLLEESAHYKPSLVPILEFGISIIAPTLVGLPAALKTTGIDGSPSIGFKPVM